MELNNLLLLPTNIIYTEKSEHPLARRINFMFGNDYRIYITELGVTIPTWLDGGSLVGDSAGTATLSGLFSCHRTQIHGQIKTNNTSLMHTALLEYGVLTKISDLII